MNRSGRAILGLEEDEDVTRLRISDLKLKWADKKIEENAITTAIRTGCWQGECAFKHQDGREMPTSTTLIAHKSISGAVEVWSIISHDITERKKADELVSTSLIKLETNEKSKTRFLAAASHDLRQPITAACLLVETLKGTSPNPQQNELIERLDESMKIFSGMLERMMDISKYDAGLIKANFTLFDLKAMLLWQEQNFTQAAFNKKLCFRLFFPSKIPLMIRSDIGLIRYVLMNLISNAIKFTEQGSILISARPRGNSALVQVWDTGIGIAEEALPHIFDEYYQVANKQRSRDRGLGLGLSICQRAMSVLGSKVSCRSRVGRGSVFEIRIPLSCEQHDMVAPTNINKPDNATHKMLFSGKRLAVIEDDMMVANALALLLKEMGGEVTCVYNAESALKDTNIMNADYYIIDYMLGGDQNGIQFLNQLRQMHGKPINAVIITGDTSTDFMRKAKMFDWPVLHKPINKSNLISSLGL